MAVSKIYSISDDEFKKLIASSNSYNAVLKFFGLSHGRSQNDIVKRRCNELGISCDHFVKIGHASQPIYQNEEIFVENSQYKGGTSKLKTKILKDNLIPYQCAICGNTGMWNNMPLVLQLDHINGNHLDNRLNNLRFLCPNCHTQTETYGSKRGTKSDE